MKITTAALVATLTCSAVMTAGPALAEEPCFRVLVHHDNSAAELDVSEVERMFLKKVKKWPDGTTIAPVDQTEDSPVRERFSQAMLGRSASSIKSYWQRQIFAGVNVPPPVLASDREVLDFVRRDPGAIGYVDCAHAQAPGVMALDFPTEQKRPAVPAASRSVPAGLAAAAESGKPQELRAFSLEHASARDVVHLLARSLQFTNALEAGDDDLLLIRDTADRVDAATKFIGAVDLAPAEVDLDLELLILDGGRADAMADLIDHTRRLTPDALERLRGAARGLATTGLPVIDRRRTRWWLSQSLVVGTGDKKTTIEGGLDLHLRPRIHADGEVTLEVQGNWIDAVRPDAEGDAGESASPEVTSFTDAWQARLAPGEALLASTSRLLAGRRGVIAKSLFGDAADGELLLIVTPHIVRHHELSPSDLEIVCAGAGDSSDLCADAAPEEP